MNNLATILIIVVVLVICVIGITIIQKREAEKEALRQKIAKYKYRANKAATILSNVESLPVGKEFRLMVLQYIIGYLNAVKKLAPNDSVNLANLESFKQAKENCSKPQDNQALAIPSDFEKLKVLISHLNSLINFANKIKASPTVGESTARAAIHRLSLLIVETKICAYVQRGKTALGQQQYVIAQQYFSSAKDMLEKMTNKSSRLVQLESDLAELMQSSPDEENKPELDLTETETERTEGESLAAEPEQEPVSPPETDDLFGPKKKW